MMKLLVERSADMEAVYPEEVEWDPAHWREPNF
jgi:hypothetical protein